jgi:tRNA C32,U32 (ribose-2'-O)-methylase TrmJ
LWRSGGSLLLAGCRYRRTAGQEQLSSECAFRTFRPFDQRRSDATLADATPIDGLLQHWQRTLVAIDFLDPEAPRKLMPRLQQLLNRAQLTQEEVHILRGIADAAAMSP